MFMNVTTGFGYFVKGGRKYGKYVLNPGQHPHPGEDVTVVEVADQAALNAVNLDPIPLSVNDQKIMIRRQLDQLDMRSIRALRANETERIADLEAEAVELRSQLQELEA